MSEDDDSGSRLDAILDVLMSYAKQDFTPRIHVSTRLDEIDAIATGINLLAEELDGAVASRRELEAALATLRATQDALVVAEKFAAIGQLANGVAHELNNPATWVLLGIEQAQRKLATARELAPRDGALAPLLATVGESLDQVHAGLERMRAVISDLRTLSRIDADQRITVDLADTVRAACQLARPAYHSVARLELDLGDTPPLVGDPGRLGQLITNLVINAAHALADRPSGDNEIRISTRTRGTEVVLAVEDTGPGIPDELLERVFEPYFTTKPAEVGMGLGLALVQRIARQHGGTARAMRGARGGARIEVRLPVPRDTPLPPVEPASTASPTEPVARPRVLLIDDEPLLLRTLAEAARAEVDVEAALGGEAALELLARDRRFDLVVCDLQMPKLDAVGVHERLGETAPELVDRFVVMTGGAVTARATRFMQAVRPRVLAKPIDVDELIALARDVTRPRGG